MSKGSKVTDLRNFLKRDEIINKNRKGRQQRSTSSRSTMGAMTTTIIIIVFRNSGLESLGGGWIHGLPPSGGAGDDPSSDLGQHPLQADSSLTLGHLRQSWLCAAWRSENIYLTKVCYSCSFSHSYCLGIGWVVGLEWGLWWMNKNWTV